MLLVHHKCGSARGEGPHQTLFVHAALLTSCPACAVPQRKRAEAEKQLAAAQDDLKHMTEELIEAQVGVTWQPAS